MKSNPFPQMLLDHPLWEKNKCPIWLISNFLISRNLASHPFPPKMTEAQSEQTYKLLEQSLLKSSNLEHPVFLPSESLSNTEKTFLAEHFLTPESFSTLHRKEGYLIDSTASFLATINAHDHLLLQCSECESAWKEAWDKLSTIETELGQMYDFAYSHKFGYLTADLSSCGTGLLVQAFLHLPTLIHLEQIEETLEKESGEEVQAFGMAGPLEFTGDLVIIQNRFTIGLTESHILESVHNTATQLVQFETKAREKLKENPNPLILDKISRSYGILLHSFQIETREVLDALSFLKLGIHLKWVHGMTDQKINEIFFTCRRGHLGILSNQEIPQQELAHKRANYLHEKLKTLKLNLP